ncbi:uncharacterized protein GGS22DRAFT_172100 [Annulohypoxylon maeteangense]|uniref:uncharacterized protein n=1 Tax=Annulohypoxylon maeteangense TaxID=1927788 RepID=UPI0020088315|nr:uncharacterized protein GGS22DRAFT_172100 [Annulohypoxylon maeteangense]KAI0881413.1 hypothetical protein GGS22DRAFT_172100 [Annulohypoxylon maeteangense]
MALVGLSLILASVVYAAIWKPPFIQTLLAIWRGDPKIQQPPTTRRPTRAEARTRGEDEFIAIGTRNDEPLNLPVPVEVVVTTETADRAAMPPPPLPSLPPKLTTQPPHDETSTSPQTTPKAAPSINLDGDSIPSFSLSASPPASSAAIARHTEAQTVPAVLPTLTAPSPPQTSVPALAAPTLGTMRPPPRPPVPNNLNNSPSSGGSLLGVPSRGPVPNRQHQYDRQPGSSTLAPPPTHSSKPAKPSRKVTLEPGRSPLDWARLANHPSSDLRNLGPGAPYLRVTPSMLRRQTGRKGKDAWTALGGRVYNITPYLPFHPGGEPELLRVAGRDGSKLFGEIHPWVNYETMLSSCMIGLLVEEHEARSTGDMDAMD